MKVTNIGTYKINLLCGKSVDLGEEVDVELSDDENRVFVVKDKVLKVVEKADKKKIKEMI